jgi:hypothetical protein
MASRVFHIAAHVAIPVGHRVSITVFADNVGVVRPKMQPVPLQPWVQDLTTGIVYGRSWHYLADVTSDIARLPLEPRKDLQVVEQIIGVVRATRIVRGPFEPASDAYADVTTLLVSIGD